MKSDIGNKEVFAKNLRHYLEISGTTQRALADEINVAYSTMNEWLKGKIYPRIDKIERMARYFGIQKSDLIEDKSKFAPDRLSYVMKMVSSDEESCDLIIEILSLDKERRDKIATFIDMIK